MRSRDTRLPLQRPRAIHDCGREHTTIVAYANIDHAPPAPRVPTCRLKNKNSPLSPSSIRADDDAILPPLDIPLDVRYHQRLRIEIVNGEVEKALDLARVEVHRNDVIAPGDGKHVRNELGGDRCARLVLLVHARIGEAGDDGCDAPGGRALARGHEYEELHEVVVHVAAAGLDDVHVLVAHGLGDFHVDLSIRELLHRARREGDVQPGEVSLDECLPQRRRQCLMERKAHRSTTA